MSDPERMSVSLPRELLERLDGAVQSAGYDSRSEATRDALRSFLTDIERRQGLSGEFSGSVVVLYDHGRGSVTDEMTALQHEFAETVVAVQHVHLAEHLCLESIAVNGAGERIKTLLDRLRPLNGVREVELAVVEG